MPEPCKKKCQTDRHNGGFWVPDRFVRDHLEVVRPTGASVYLLLAACEGLDSYPTHFQIAAKLNLNPEFVRDAVLRLARRGLITAAEMVKVIGDPKAVSAFNAGLTESQRAELARAQDPTPTEDSDDE